MGATTYAGLASLLVALYIWYRKTSTTPSSASLPPGPKPVPLLGNIRDLTTKELWLPASQWAKQFGDVTYLHVLGQGLVFLNSPEAAFDLLDKRGSIYSDKPQLVMVGDLCGCKHMVAFTGYGDESKRQRRLMHKAFGLGAIPSYHPLISTQTNTFLRRLITSPTEYVAHTRRYAGGLTLNVVYGYEAKSNNDPFLSLAEECVNLLSNKIASGGGIWPVDVFPALQHMPDWMPGSGFKKNARVWKAKMEEFVDAPYEFVKESMKSNNYQPSFCSTLLEDETAQATEDFEFNLKWAANSMYSASADTTMTTVSHFLLAMMQHPEVLLKAQKEIDAVVGDERLPEFADRERLPYLDAILSETWRWGVPVPLNLPHRLMEDDVYRGMHIPKGSLVFGNIWAIVRDERIYPNADAFDPERFLRSDLDEETKRKMNPRNYVFGFGRRLCPGNNLVESSIWLLLACMIATLDISKARDETGKVVEPEVKFENPIFRIPNPFKCDIRPRSERALRLIRESEIL
ncbi:cytochrome P450 [Crucibulum laeve]|uniref:Cytochrome P450 n=1 Tax=Crucibulum laeve TaxID=68775 RepID=A0A5C3LPH7_9AGAR|nr:cytochrome P450 [Crucibulum laeve]